MIQSSGSRTPPGTPSLTSIDRTWTCASVKTKRVIQTWYVYPRLDSHVDHLRVLNISTLVHCWGEQCTCRIMDCFKEGQTVWAILPGGKTKTTNMLTCDAEWTCQDDGGCGEEAQPYAPLCRTGTLNKCVCARTVPQKEVAETCLNCAAMIGRENC